ncbi:MAG: family intrarane metalloprotease [Pseudoduganella sp.]|nr:family intrarane metalloprotease [Pseudoduganella sp.]
MLAQTAVCGTALLSPDLAAVLRLLVLAPLLEEWVVRAGLHAWLLPRAGAPLAILASAVAFSALHLHQGVLAAALVFGPGVAFGLAYQRWRDWRWCAVLHSAGNAWALSMCAGFPIN